jgi:hypothetical protein
MGAMAVGSLFRFRHFYHIPYSASTGATSAPVNPDGTAEPRKSLPTIRVDKVLL